MLSASVCGLRRFWLFMRGTGAWNRGYCLCADGSTSLWSADICYCRSVHRVSDSQAKMWRDYAIVRGFPVIGLLLVLMVPMWMGAETCGRGGVAIVCGDEYGGDCCAAGECGVGAGGEFSGVATDGDGDDGGWMFKAGIARPIRAEITGSGVGATSVLRIFDGEGGGTGDAVGSQAAMLEVDVIQTPPAMQRRHRDLSKRLHPAHAGGIYGIGLRARFQLD